MKLVEHLQGNTVGNSLTGTCSRGTLCTHGETAPLKIHLKAKNDHEAVHQTEPQTSNALAFVDYHKKFEKFLFLMQHTL